MPCQSRGCPILAFFARVGATERPLNCIANAAVVPLREIRQTHCLDICGVTLRKPRRVRQPRSGSANMETAKDGPARRLRPLLLPYSQFFGNSRIIRYIKYRLHFSVFDNFGYAVYSDYFVGWVTRGKSGRRMSQLERLRAFQLAIYLCPYLPLRVLQYECRTTTPWLNVVVHLD